MSKIKHITEPQPYNLSIEQFLEYESDLDFVYECHGLVNRVDPGNFNFYVRLNDIDTICGDEPYVGTREHWLLAYMRLPKIELLTENRLCKNQIYAKVINTSIIRIYKGFDGNYYTIEKMNENNLSLYKMKCLKDYIDEQTIYEGILNSWDAKTVKQKLIDFIGVESEEITEEPATGDNDKHKITISANNILLDDKTIDMFKQFANMAGYTYSEIGKKIILSPYHPASADHIVKKNKNIVYHVTSKYFYDKIKDKDYIPLRSDVNFPANKETKGSKERLYCFCSNNVDNLAPAFDDFRRMSNRIRDKKISHYYDKDFLLIIDLSKTDKEIKWYYDSSYSLYGLKNSYALFTNDYIPTECIIATNKLKNGRIVEE